MLRRCFRKAYGGEEARLGLASRVGGGTLQRGKGKEMVLNTTWEEWLELCDLVVGSRKERLGREKCLFF